jgi:hypothetical protein
MSTPTIKEPQSPKLLDKFLSEYNLKLIAALPWLNAAFGKAQQLTRYVDKKVIRYPGIYTGVTQDYINLFPCEQFGNFSFWDVADPYSLEWIANQQQVVDANFGFIVWMNLNNVLNIEQGRNLESIKGEILQVFDAIRIVNCRLQITSISERAENIYKGYSIQEAETQFLMHPFAGLRFEGTLKAQTLCQ